MSSKAPHAALTATALAAVKATRQRSYRRIEQAVPAFGVSRATLYRNLTEAQTEG